MTPIKALLMALLLGASAYCCADSRSLDSGKLFGHNAPQWGNVHLGMSPDHYGKVSRDNMRTLKKSAQHLISGGLTTLGIPKGGMALTGAAIGLATNSLKFNLDKEKRLRLDFNNVTSGKRGVYLNFNLDW